MVASSRTERVLVALTGGPGSAVPSRRGRVVTGWLLGLPGPVGARP